MRGIEPGGRLETVAFAARSSACRRSSPATGTCRRPPTCGPARSAPSRRRAHNRATGFRSCRGSEPTSESTTKAYFGGRELAIWSGGGGVDLKGRLAGGFERGLEIEQAAIVVGVVHEQRMARVGPLHGKIVDIVGGQRVGRIDPHFALVAAVGHIQGEEFHGGAAALGHFHGLGFHRAPVEQSVTLRWLCACRSRPRWPARGSFCYRKRAAAPPRFPPRNWAPPWLPRGAAPGAHRHSAADR